MPGLQIHLFGSFNANLDGQAITTFSYDKVRALFAYLAMEFVGAGLSEKADQ
jgi:DNA-binding SARP family transcriptional activator